MRAIFSLFTETVLPMPLLSTETASRVLDVILKGLTVFNGNSHNSAFIKIADSVNCARTVTKHVLSKVELQSSLGNKVKVPVAAGLTSHRFCVHFLRVGVQLAGTPTLRAL